MEGIVIVDYGSQYTRLIARKVRELGCCTEIVPPTRFARELRPRGIVLTGSPSSVTDSLPLPSWVEDSDLPVLGICYGMQLLVAHAGGKIAQDGGSGFGREEITVAGRDPLFADVPVSSAVWMSHHDHVSVLPAEMTALAHDARGTIVAVKHNKRAHWGLQFHPEVSHTEHGLTMLKNFCASICKLPCDWNAQSMLPRLRESIREQGAKRVLHAVSGGVDSTVSALLATQVLGEDRVICVFVDNGLLRAEEAKEVSTTLRKLGLRNLHVLDRSKRFLKNLRGVTDPEQKRKIVGRTFIEVFEEFALTKEDVTHLGQGTLYADVIESGRGEEAATIKSHHNVGGLPREMNLQLLEPLRFLFKDEVRAIGAELGIPSTILERHPFPGPGLAIRIMGEVTAERLEILRAADKIFLNALREQGFMEKVWQAFCVYLPVESVGVAGDRRHTGATIVLRAVMSVDAMTASVSTLPLDFLTKVANKITAQVKGINRVVFDLTSKPPATIEWE